MKKGFYVAIITIALLVITAPVYGSQTETFKDETICLTFSDGWSIASEDRIPHDIDNEIKRSEEDIQYNFEPYLTHVFYAVKRIDGQDTILKLIYSGNDTPSKQDVAESAFYWQEPSVTSGASETLDSAFGSFKKIPVYLKSDNQTIQRIVYHKIIDQTDITFLLQTKNGKLTKKQMAEADAIIKTFNDTGYYKTDFPMPTDNLGIWLIFFLVVLPGMIYGPVLLIKYLLQKKGYRTVIGSELKAVLNYPSDHTFEALVSAIKPLKQFIIKESNPDTGFLRLKAKMGSTTSGEKLLIQVTPNSDGTTDLFITSRCRFRIVLSDWGKNHENLRVILKRLLSVLNRYPKLDNREPVRAVTYSSSKEHNAALRKFRKTKDANSDFSPEAPLENNDLAGFYDKADSLAIKRGIFLTICMIVIAICNFYRLFT